MSIKSLHLYCIYSASPSGPHEAWPEEHFGGPSDQFLHRNMYFFKEIISCCNNFVKSRESVYLNISKGRGVLFHSEWCGVRSKTCNTSNLVYLTGVRNNLVHLFMRQSKLHSPSIK